MQTTIKRLALSLLISLAFAGQVHAVPIADDGLFQTPAGTQVNGILTDFVSGFTDPDFSVISAPAHGLLVLQLATGAFSYTPNPGYTGPDAFGYGAFESPPLGPPLDTGTISINVCPAGTCTPGRVSLPEPASALLLLCGIAGLAIRVTRRQ